MSVGLRAVQWNRQKLVYDAILLVCATLYIAAFGVLAGARSPIQ